MDSRSEENIKLINILKFVYKYWLLETVFVIKIYSN